MSADHRAEPHEVDALLAKLTKEAKDSGYQLNPDEKETRELVEGLVVNQKRYGYPACPCRLASGIRDKDLDIICPCDYRDPDLNEFGACYCALYVEERTPEMKPLPVLERRPAGGPTVKQESPPASSGGLKVWLCNVCGYLCAREKPPAICPICKVGKDRFRVFMG
jgi:ferredoxin-thioredoxin reductase catalytic subunit/rubredoxin